MTSYTLLNWDGSHASAPQDMPDAAGPGNPNVPLNPNHPHNQTTALNSLNTTTLGVGVQPVNPHTTTVSTVGPLTSYGGTGGSAMRPSASLLQALVDYDDDSDMDVSVDEDEDVGVGVQEGMILNDASGTHSASGVEASLISASGVQEQTCLTDSTLSATTTITMTNTSPSSLSTTLPLSLSNIELPNPPSVHNEPTPPQIHTPSTSKSPILTPIIAPTPTMPPILTPPTPPPVQAQAQMQTHPEAQTQARPQPQPHAHAQPLPELPTLLNTTRFEFRPEVNSPLHADIIAPIQPTQGRNLDAEPSASLQASTHATSTLAPTLSFAPTPATPGSSASVSGPGISALDSSTLSTTENRTIRTIPLEPTSSSVLPSTISAPSSVLPISSHSNPVSGTTTRNRHTRADQHGFPQLKSTPIRGENTGRGRGADRDDAISINTEDGEGENDDEVSIVPTVQPSATRPAQPKPNKPPHKALNPDGRSKPDAGFKTNMATPQRANGSGLEGGSKEGWGNKPPGTGSKTASSKPSLSNSSPSKPGFLDPLNSKAGPSTSASSKASGSNAKASGSNPTSSKLSSSRPTSSMSMHSSLKPGMLGSTSSKPIPSMPSSPKWRNRNMRVSVPFGTHFSSYKPSNSTSKPSISNPSTSGPSTSKPSTSNLLTSRPQSSKPLSSTPKLPKALSTSRPDPAKTPSTTRLPIPGIPSTSAASPLKIIIPSLSSSSKQKKGSPSTRMGDKTDFSRERGDKTYSSQERADEIYSTRERADKAFSSREKHGDRASDSRPAPRPVNRPASVSRPASRMDSESGVGSTAGAAFQLASGSTIASASRSTFASASKSTIPSTTGDSAPRTKTPTKAPSKPPPPPPIATHQPPSPHSSPLFTPKTTPQTTTTPLCHPGDYDLSKLFTPEQSPVSPLSVLSSDEARSRAGAVGLGEASGSGSRSAHASKTKRRPSLSSSHTKMPRAQGNYNSNSDSRTPKNTTVSRLAKHDIATRPWAYPSTSTSNSDPRPQAKPKTTPKPVPIPILNPIHKPRSNLAYVSIPALKRPKYEYVKYEREAKLVAKMRSLGIAIETRRYAESLDEGGGWGFGNGAGLGAGIGIGSGGSSVKGGVKERNGIKEKKGGMQGRDGDWEALRGKKVRLGVKDGKKRKRDDDVWWDDSGIGKGAEAGGSVAGRSPKKIQKLGEVAKSKAKAKAREREDEWAAKDAVIDLTMDDVDDRVVPRPGPQTKSVLRDTANADTSIRRPVMKSGSAAAARPKSPAGTTPGITTAMPPPPPPSRPKPRPIKLKAKDMRLQSVDSAGPQSYPRPKSPLASRRTGPPLHQSEKANAIDVGADAGSTRALSPLPDIPDVPSPGPAVGWSKANSAPVASSSSAMKSATAGPRLEFGTAGPSNYNDTPTTPSHVIHRRSSSDSLFSSPALSADADPPATSLLFSAFQPPPPPESSLSHKKSRKSDEPDLDRGHKRRKHSHDNDANRDMDVDDDPNANATSSANPKLKAPNSVKIRVKKSGSKSKAMSIWGSSAVPITSQREANCLCPAVTRLNLSFEFPSGRVGKDGKENEGMGVGMGVVVGRVERDVSEGETQEVGERMTEAVGYDGMNSVYWRPARGFFDVRREAGDWEEDSGGDYVGEDQREDEGVDEGDNMDVGPEGEYGLGLQLSLTRGVSRALKRETRVPIGEFWDEVVVPLRNHSKTLAPSSNSKSRARASNTAPPPEHDQLMPSSSSLTAGATTRSEGDQPNSSNNDWNVLDNVNSDAGSAYGASSSVARNGILSAKALGKRKSDPIITTATTNDDDDDIVQHSNDTSSLAVTATGIHSAFSDFRSYPVGSALLRLAPFSVNAVGYASRQRTTMKTPLKDQHFDIFIHQYTDLSPERPFGDQGGGGDGGDTNLMDGVTTSMSTSESSHSSGAHNDITDQYQPETMSDASHALFSEVMGGAGGSLLDFQSEMGMENQMQTQLWDAYEFDPVERAGDGVAAPTVGPSGLGDGRFTTIDPTLLGGGASAEEVLEAGMAVAEKGGEWERDGTMEEDEEEEHNRLDEEERERDVAGREASESSEDSDESSDDEVAPQTVEKGTQSSIQDNEGGIHIGDREKEKSSANVPLVEVSCLPSPSPSVHSLPRLPSSSGVVHVGREETQSRKSTRERKESERKREASLSQSSEPVSTRKFKGVVLSDEQVDADTRLASYESLTSDMDKANNPGDVPLIYCHQCRRPANLVMLACNTCRKSFCIRCLALRYVALEFDISPGVFTCPACFDFCNCTVHARKRQEEYVSGIIDDAPLLFDNDSDTSSPPPPAPAVDCFDLSAPVPSGVELWGAIYNLQGDKIGSAVIAQQGVARVHTPDVYAQPLPVAIRRQPPAKRRRIQPRPLHSDSTRVFVGIAQRCWGLGSKPKTKVLHKIPRVKKGVHSYVGNSKLLKCRIIPSQLDDMSDLSSLPSSDEDEDEGEGEGEGEDEDEDEVVGTIDSVFSEPTPDPAVASGALEADDVARAISMALEACGHFTKN